MGEEYAIPLKTTLVSLGYRKGVVEGEDKMSEQKVTVDQIEEELWELVKTAKKGAKDQIALDALRTLIELKEKQGQIGK